MTGGIALTGYPYGGLDANSLPYFMATQGGYYPSFMGAQQTPTAYGVGQENTNLQPIQQNPAVTTTTETKSNNGLILGGILAVGATALCIAAHKKADGKGLKEGFKQLWNGVRGKNVTKDKFKIAQDNGTWYCNLPGRSQTIAKVDAATVGLNVSNDVVKLGEKGTQLKGVEFTHNGNTFRVNGDTIVRYKNGAGENLMSKLKSTETADVEYSNTLKEIIKKLQKGEAPDGVTVQRQYWTHTDGDVVRRFTQEGTAAPVMHKNIRTNRYATNSDHVTAYRSQHSSIDEALKQIEKGKIPENFHIASAFCPLADGNRIVIKNGAVDGIEIGGHIHHTNSTKFIAYKQRHPEAFEKLKDLTKDKHLQEIVYAAA